MTKPWHFRFDDAVRDSRDLSTSERALLFVLRTHANGRTGDVPERFAPSLTTLGHETGMARRSVSRILESVVTKGWVVVRTPTTATAIRENRTNSYILRIPSPPSEIRSSGVVTQGADPRDTTSHYQYPPDLRHGAAQHPTGGTVGRRDAYADIWAAVAEAEDEWVAEECATAMLSRDEPPERVARTIRARTAGTS